MTYFDETAAALTALDQGELIALRRAVRRCMGTVWICGNGGSYATAQHWACDLSKAAGLRCQALGVNGAVLTAWANDASYADALAAEFARQVRADDLLICLSCSGTSPNVRAVIDAAARFGIPRVLLTKASADVPAGILAVRVASEDYGVIEDVHLSIGHWLTKELG